MNNVFPIKNCYGCGVCVAICPKHIIDIRLNKKGFYEPTLIDSSRCVECGLCLKTCAFHHKDISEKDYKISAWAAWSNDERVRQKCSSGGIGFEIVNQLIKKGFKAVVCRYDVKEQRAEHYIANTANELLASIGSKYMQSYTPDAFRRIDRKQKYVVVGTPCQIDSFRRMIQLNKCETNFVLVDFFCHSVPSMHAWKNYMKMLEPKIGKLTYASWRNKFQYGWHDSWLMGLDGEKNSEPVNWHDDYDMLIKEKKCFIQSRMSQGDWYYKMFLGDLCHGIQCTKACKYKYDKSSADIRIGDLWGKTYKNDEKGVSALITFTNKGDEIVSSLVNVTIISHPFDIVAEGQMKQNATINPMRGIVMTILTNGIYPTEEMWDIIFGIFQKPVRAVAKIRNRLKGL